MWFRLLLLLLLQLRLPPYRYNYSNYDYRYHYYKQIVGKGPTFGPRRARGFWELGPKLGPERQGDSSNQVQERHGHTRIWTETPPKKQIFCSY